MRVQDLFAHGDHFGGWKVVHFKAVKFTNIGQDVHDITFASFGTRVFQRLVNLCGCGTAHMAQFVVTGCLGRGKEP